MKEKKIRTRFAPSPTGEVHIGSVRTALFNFLFARRFGGKNVLRIEDTDAKRYVPGSVERLIEGLKWLGIDFDEYPIIENSKSKTVNNDCKLKINNSCGKYGPYIQSERLGIYQEYAQKLLEDGNAYYCFCSEDRLKKMREDQVAKKQAPMYDRKCLTLKKDEIAENLKNNKPYVIRLKVPYSDKTDFIDLIRGDISIDNSTIDDQILIKSDGMPTYHLANVIDDHLMEISHVFRAEEWLPSAPKHIILYKFFDWTPPQFGHVPLVLAPDRSKLSKRHGAVSVEEFKLLGYLPEALINYIALLGWNPKNNQEFFTLKELIKEFDITKINKAGAIFDIEKLNYFNSHYIKQKSIDELKLLIANYSKISLKINNLDKIIVVIKDRMVKLSDFDKLSKMFLSQAKYDAKLLIFKKSTKDLTIRGLSQVAVNLTSADKSEWESVDKLNKVLLETVEKNGLTNGDVFWPVRMALSGAEKSPSPPELLWVLGKNESIKRINHAIEILSGS